VGVAPGMVGEGGAVAPGMVGVGWAGCVVVGADAAGGVADGSTVGVEGTVGAHPFGVKVGARVGVAKPPRVGTGAGPPLQAHASRAIPTTSNPPAMTNRPLRFIIPGSRCANGTVPA